MRAEVEEPGYCALDGPPSGSSITRIAVDDRPSILREKSIEINNRLDPMFDTWKHPCGHKISVAPAYEGYILQVFHLNMKCHIFNMCRKISRSPKWRRSPIPV